MATDPSGFGDALTQLAPLLLAIAILTLGHGLHGTLLALRAGIDGIDPGGVGTLMSAYFLGFVVGSIWCVRLIEAVGHIRTFAALASVTSAVALAHALHVDVVVWSALRFVNGVCFAGMILVVESWLNAGTESRWRGRVLALYGTVTLAVWAASQPILSLTGPAGFVPFCIVSILVSLALVPVALTRTDAPSDLGAERLSARRLFEISPIGLVGTFLIGIWASAFWGMGPTFGQMTGMETAGTAALMSTVMIGAALGQWPVGWLSDLVDRRLVIGAGAGVAAIAGLGLAMSGADGYGRYAWALLYGAMSITLYSVCIAHVNDRVAKRELLAAASGLLVSYGAGSTLGPVLAGAAMERFGAAALFYGSGAIQGALALFIFARMILQRAVPRKDKSGFVAMPTTSTSHLGVELNRHVEDERQSHR